MAWYDAVGFFANPENAPVRTTEYSFTQNPAVLSQFDQMPIEEQEAARKQLALEEILRDINRGIASHAIDLTPFTSRGRSAFAGEDLSFSDIYDSGYVNNLNSVARQLYGASKPGQSNDFKIGKSRYNEVDKEIANKLLTPALNANLPMDIPEVREYAINMFKSGASLDEVQARTRQWILDKSGASSLDEFMKNRDVSVFNRLLRSANSSMPARFLGDVYGISDVNAGYYDPDAKMLFKTPKDIIGGAQLANMVGLSKLPGIAGKTVGVLASPYATMAAAGSNIYNAHANTAGKEERRRFIMAELAKGNDLLNPNTNTLLRDVVINAHGLPLSGWVGPGAATRLMHQGKMLASSEYRAEIEALKKELEANGFLEATGRWKRDKHNILRKAHLSATEDLTSGLANAGVMSLLAGKLYPAYVAGGTAIGAGSGIIDAIKKWGDKNNGVIDDDTFSVLERDNPRTSSELYNQISMSAKSGLRTAGMLLKDPIRVGKQTIGIGADFLKYAPTLWNADKIMAENARPITDEEANAKRKPYAPKPKTKQTQPVDSQPKTASDTLYTHNKYPSSGALAKLESLDQETQFRPKEDAKFARFLAKQYSRNGESGVALASSLRALKPTNLINILAGTGKSYAADMDKEARKAMSRYAANPYGLVPPILMYPFSDDAKAAVVSRRAANKVKKISKNAEIPMRVVQASALAAALGYGAYKLNNKRRDNEQEYSI